MADKFVSEKELEEQRKLRQSEWEKVRKPEDPKDAPEPEYDSRPLYERLKEQREKKQLEYEETHKLKNMVRGLDSEEVGFLDFVDNMKSAEERKREKEEKDLLAEVQKLKKQETLEKQEIAASSSFSTPTPKKPCQRNGNQQAKLITGAIKRKSSEDVVDSVSKKRGISEATAVEKQNGERTEMGNVSSERSKGSGGSMAVECGLRPSAMQCLGILPGMGDYTNSSDESSDDSDSDDGDFSTVLLPSSQSLRAVDGSASSSDGSAKISRTASMANEKPC